jgi:tetratricopeptide (TPR) repeat protein
MTGVFISYRRADTGPWAGRLSDHLNLRFGKDLVFQDIDDIKPGEDFLQVIRTKIKTCEVVLVLIGPYWLRDAKGRRRLDDPKDVLVMEISEALMARKTVIPLLLGGASMPSPRDLPEPIKSLSTKHAAEITESRWHYDVEQLIERLRELVITSAEHISLPQAQQELNQQQLHYFDILPHNPAEALELSQKAFAYLDRVSPLYPQDPYLQVLRGYFHKNEAMALRNLKRYEEFQKALNEAERVFNTMTSERPKDASAWNGKGSVEMLRGNFEMALHFVDLALEYDPNHEGAQRDRQEILRHLPENK